LGDARNVRGTGKTCPKIVASKNGVAGRNNEKKETVRWYNQYGLPVHHTPFGI